MSSGRKFSVNRHVQNIHLGTGGIIPYMDYLTGRRQGNVSSITRKRSNLSHSSFSDKVMAEVENDLVRKIASSINGSVENPQIQQFVQIFRQKRINDLNAAIFKEIQGFISDNN